MIDIEFDEDLVENCQNYPWDISFEDFIGDYHVDMRHTIDGRRDFDYDWIWDAAENDENLSEILAENSEGYCVRRINNSNPVTFVLFDEQSNACGFYSGVESWIDPHHRGMDLSVMLISVASFVGNGSPQNNGRAYGFSPSGLRSHQKAHEFLSLFAVDNGFEILEENKIEYFIPNRPAY